MKRHTLALLSLAGIALVALGVMVGSMGWSPPWRDDTAWQIARDIRLPRTLGAWFTGALLGLAGAVSQGLFRNPLADPYLLGSASGASLGVALMLAASGSMAATLGWHAGWQSGLTLAAFAGACLAVLLTLVLARGAQHTTRLLLAGVIVGVVVGAIKDLVVLLTPESMRAMQSFAFGTTGLLGWANVSVLAGSFALALIGALAGSRALDALALGEHGARSLGIRLNRSRAALVVVLSFATGAAVAQSGLIAFVGLVAPQLVRGSLRGMHDSLLLGSTLAGGALLLAADIAARWLFAPIELPVGVFTAVIGGGYLLWRLGRLAGLR